MKGFYIDSATQMALLALFEDDKVLGFQKIPVGPLAKGDIFETLESLFKESRTEFSNLDFIGLGIGPGSYTGIRVASSIGATLAYSLNIPLITLSSMDGYEGDVVIFDAKRGQVYVKEGDGEPRLIAAEALKGYTGKIVSSQDGEPSLDKIGRLLGEKFSKGEFTDPKGVNLIYLQNPYIG
jgi:tRNA threonylcarbamoyl adenosine modification protein YeaZ